MGGAAVRGSVRAEPATKSVAVEHDFRRYACLCPVRRVDPASLDFEKIDHFGFVLPTAQLKVVIVYYCN